MKKLLLILLCLPMIFSCRDEKNKIENDLSKENIIGNPKEIKEYHYSAKELFGEAQKEKLLHENILRFNSEGNITEFIRNNSQSYKTYYNEITKQKEKTHIYDGEELVGLKKYKYDENGNQIEESSYSDGELVGFKKYKYDENGNQIEESSYSNGKLVDLKKYKYDENGNQIEKSSYSDGELDRRSFKYKYDKNGIQIEKGSYFEGKLERFYKYKYDENGNKIETNKFYSDGELGYSKKNKYSYFKNKNWIKYIEYNEQNNPTYIIEREFIY